MSISKRLYASSSILDLLSWAVLSLFSTRLFLELSAYPSLGNGNWHIAHVLWGGLFMLSAIILLLAFYGNDATKYASILGGIGWGLFIDEIGKYLSRDNDYWFRPAVIFIYISFIILFFVYRYFERKTKADRSSLWNKILDDCHELVNQDFENKEKVRLLSKINQLSNLSLSKSESKILHDLKDIVNSIQSKKDKKEFNLAKLIAAFFKISYSKLFRKKLVFYGLFLYSFYYVVDKFIDIFRLIFNPQKISLLQSYYLHYDFFSKADVYMITIKFVIEIIVASLYFVGLTYLVRRKTFRGLRFYQLGLLINIFLGSVIKFYFEQFSAVFGLITAVLIYSWLKSYREELSSIIRASKNTKKSSHRL